MRAEALLVAWHMVQYPEPVLAADFSPLSQRLATCGADNTVKVWSYALGDDGRMNIEFLANLDRHIKSVNCVRFSPVDDRLASCGDDHAVFVYRLTGKPPEPGSDNKESWDNGKMLSQHSADVYDLAWSPDGSKLVTGSIDNTVIVWDVENGKALARLTEASHYVQGVAWDPLNSLLCSVSSDRGFRIYSRSITHALKGRTAYSCAHNVRRRTFTACDGTTECSHNYFRDETISTFFRRPCFSPDGSIILAPTAQFREDADGPLIHTTYVFSRHSLSRPALHLPLPGQKVTVAARFSPVLYHKLHSTGDGDAAAAVAADGTPTNPLAALPYRMIFAVATVNAVFVYDTENWSPIAYATDLHFASLTDLSWSSDGRILCVASSDGYCSFLTFAEGELGTPLPKEESDALVRQLREKEELRFVKTGPSRKRVRKPKKTAVAAAATSSEAMNVDGVTATTTPSAADTSPDAAAASSGSSSPPSAAVSSVAFVCDDDESSEDEDDDEEEEEESDESPQTPPRLAAPPPPPPAQPMSVDGGENKPLVKQKARVVPVLVKPA